MSSDSYFKENSAPGNLDAVSKNILDFISVNQKLDKKVVLVTSGGTTVPLETNTVRFLDNFSAGTRGATSAEYFIEAGYAVIFLHRQFSLEPYTRHYTHSKNCFLDLLEFKGPDVCIKQDHLNEIKEIMQKYQEATASSLLLKISFTTVSEYLFLLRSIALLLVPLKRNALFYLAAAVSDFYIPERKMIEHKIQSGDGMLHLDLDQVPKIIKPLVEEWALDAFVVSFKLETDSSILIPKSRSALNRYGHSVVVANLLHTRKHVVWMVTKNNETEIRLTEEEQQNGVEIENTHYCLMGRPKRAAAAKAVNKLENFNESPIQTENAFSGPSSESEFEESSEKDQKSEDGSESIRDTESDLSEEEEDEGEDSPRKPAPSKKTANAFIIHSPANLYNYKKENSTENSNFNYVASEDERNEEQEEIIEVAEEHQPPDFNHADYLELIACLKKATKHEFEKSPIMATMDGKEVEVTIFDTSSSRIQCPFSFCEKSFLNLEGIKYHMLNFAHDISLFECKSSNNEIISLFETIKMKRDLVPSNLYPIEFPWVFNTKERSKPLTLKVKFTLLDKVIKNTPSGRKKSRSIKVSGDKNMLTPKLTEETAMLEIKPNEFDGNTYFDHERCFSTISQNDVYPSSFFQDKKLAFSFSKHSRIECPILTGAHRAKKNDSENYIINCGLSVWAMDWAPCNENDYQYFAVGGYTSYEDHHEYTTKQKADLNGVIQIWSLKPLESPRLSISISHNFGRVLELKWCPNNAFDSKKGRLGYLAAIFGDGSCQVIRIPLPSIEKQLNLKWEKSIFKVNMNDCEFTKMDWCSRNWLVTGSSNGSIYVWNLSSILTEDFDVSSEHLPNPLLYLNLQESIITALSFFEVKDNIYIVSASIDGTTICIDIRDPDSFVKVSKVQGLVHALCITESIESILLAEDLRIRSYRMSEDFSDIESISITSQHKGTIWMMEHSRFFPFVASASSDGSLNLANSSRPLMKKIGGVFIYTLFEASSFDETTNTLIFNDRLQEKKVEECKINIWNPRIAVQRIKWNPNRKYKHLIASAGIGWIRIDSVLMV